MSKGLKALQKLEKELSEYYGGDIAYYPKIFEMFYTISKELKALEILKKHIRIAKPFDLETKKEESFEIFDIDLWDDGKQKEDFKFVKEVLDL